MRYRNLIIFIIICLFVGYFITQSVYFMSAFYKVPYQSYIAYEEYKEKYGKHPEEGYYLLRKCKFNNTDITEVQGGWRGGGGVFNFFDESGNNTCNFYWSIDNCAQHGCTFTCPYGGRQCSIIVGSLDPQDILFE